MPVELRDRDEFLEKAARASECRVKKSKGVVKVKARTKKYLYTLKVPEEELEEFLAKLRERCPNVVEIE